MSTFLTALEAEIAELRAALMADERYSKLIELTRILEMYRRKDVTSTAHVVSASAVTGGHRPFKSGVSAEVVRVVKDFLAGRGEPVPTRSIMQEIEAQGVTVSGSAPQNTVSSILSKAPEFTSHGRRGWTLSNVVVVPTDVSAETQTSVGHALVDPSPEKTVGADLSKQLEGR